MTLSPPALAQYDAPKLAAALTRAQQRIQELEQENNALRNEIRWIDRLLAVPASIMSPSHKVTLRAAVKAYQQGTPDEHGLVQIESWKLCKTARACGGERHQRLHHQPLYWRHAALSTPTGRQGRDAAQPRRGAPALPPLQERPAPAESEHHLYALRERLGGKNLPGQSRMPS